MTDPQAIVNKLLEGDPDDPRAYLDWLGQKVETGPLDKIRFGAHIHLSDEDMIRENASEQGIDVDSQAFWDEVERCMAIMESHCLQLLREAGLHVSDEGHDETDARVASVWINTPEEDRKLALLKAVINWAEGDWPSTTSGTMDYAFGADTTQRIYAATEDAARFIDVTIEFTGTDALVEWSRLNLNEAITGDPDDPDVFLRSYMPRIMGRVFIDFDVIRPNFPDAPRNWVRDRVDGMGLFRYNRVGEMREVLRQMKADHRQRGPNVPVDVITYRYKLTNPQGSSIVRGWLDKIGCPVPVIQWLCETNAPIWFYVPAKEINDYMRMVYPQVKLESLAEGVDDPPADLVNKLTPKVQCPKCGATAEIGFGPDKLQTHPTARIEYDTDVPLARYLHPADEFDPNVSIHHFDTKHVYKCRECGERFDGTLPGYAVESVDDPDDPEMFIKRFKPRWDLLSHIKNGHFYFKDEAGRVAVADYSMRNQRDPGSADDGLLILDKTKPITRYRGIEGRKMWHIPVTQYYGGLGDKPVPSATGANEEEMADLRPKLEAMGWTFQIREDLLLQEFNYLLGCRQCKANFFFAQRGLLHDKCPDCGSPDLVSGEELRQMVTHPSVVLNAPKPRKPRKPRQPKPPAPQAPAKPSEIQWPKSWSPEVIAGLKKAAGLSEADEDIDPKEYLDATTGWIDTFLNAGMQPDTSGSHDGQFWKRYECHGFNYIVVVGSRVPRFMLVERNDALYGTNTFRRVFGYPDRDTKGLVMEFTALDRLLTKAITSAFDGFPAFDDKVDQLYRQHERRRKLWLSGKIKEALDDPEMQRYLDQASPEACKSCGNDLTKRHTVVRQYVQNNGLVHELSGHYDAKDSGYENDEQPDANLLAAMPSCHTFGDICARCGKDPNIPPQQESLDEPEQYLKGNVYTFDELRTKLETYGLSFPSNGISPWGRWAVIDGFTYWAVYSKDPNKYLPQSYFREQLEKFCKEMGFTLYHIQLFGEYPEGITFKLAVPKMQIDPEAYGSQERRLNDPDFDNQRQAHDTIQREWLPEATNDPDDPAVNIERHIEAMKPGPVLAELGFNERWPTWKCADPEYMWWERFDYMTGLKWTVIRKSDDEPHVMEVSVSRMHPTTKDWQEVGGFNVHVGSLRKKLERAFGVNWKTYEALDAPTDDPDDPEMYLRTAAPFTTVKSDEWEYGDSYLVYDVYKRLVGRISVDVNKRWNWVSVERQYLKLSAEAWINDFSSQNELLLAAAPFIVKPRDEVSEGVDLPPEDEPEPNIEKHVQHVEKVEADAIESAILNATNEFDITVRMRGIDNARRADELAAELGAKWAETAGYPNGSDEFDIVVSAVNNHCGEMFPGQWEDYPMQEGIHLEPDPDDVDPKAYAMALDVFDPLKIVEEMQALGWVHIGCSLAFPDEKVWLLEWSSAKELTHDMPDAEYKAEADKAGREAVKVIHRLYPEASKFEYYAPFSDGDFGLYFKLPDRLKPLKTRTWESVDLPPEDADPEAYLQHLTQINLADLYQQQGLQSNDNGDYGHGLMELGKPATLVWHGKTHEIEKINLAIHTHPFQQWASVSVYIQPISNQASWRTFKPLKFRYWTVPLSKLRDVVHRMIYEVEGVCLVNDLTWPEMIVQFKAAMKRFRPYKPLTPRKVVEGVDDPTPEFMQAAFDVPAILKRMGYERGSREATPFEWFKVFHRMPTELDIMVEVKRRGLGGEENEADIVYDITVYRYPVNDNPGREWVPIAYRYERNNKQLERVLLKLEDRIRRNDLRGIRDEVAESVPELPPEDDPTDVLKSHEKSLLPGELKRLDFGPKPEQGKEWIYGTELPRYWWNRYEAADGKVHGLYVYFIGGQTPELRANNWNFDAKAWFQKGGEPSPYCPAQNEAHFCAIIRDLDDAMKRSAADSLSPELEHEAIEKVLNHHRKWWDDTLDYLINTQHGTVPGRIGPGQPA